MTTIRLADFSRYPFGRYKADGPYSAEIFRRTILLDAFRRDKEPVEVVLDGARGLGSSFLEESFGGLVRDGVPVSEVRQRLRIISSLDPSHVTEINEYIDRAADGSSKKAN